MILKARVIKKTKKIFLIVSLFGVFFLKVLPLIANQAPSTLKELYKYQSSLPVTISDIGEHLPALNSIARECSTIVEIGVRDMVSTIGILQGLSENPSKKRFYLGIDINYPPNLIFREMCKLAHDNLINFQFLQGNDMDLDIPEVEFLFIDSLHTYCHLMYELEKFSSKVTKYIAMHDTSEPWGNEDENVYQGDYSEYPLHIDRTKRGLWLAVEDFLTKHPEWALKKRWLNCHGLTLLERVRNEK